MCRRKAATYLFVVCFLSTLSYAQRIFSSSKKRKLLNNAKWFQQQITHMGGFLYMSKTLVKDKSYVAMGMVQNLRRLGEAYFKIDRKEALVYGHIRKDKGYLTIGIPSVRRQNATYLEGTLESLISGTEADDRHRVVFVVFLTDSNHTWVIQRAKEVYSKFKEHVDSGLIQIVHPPHIAYPNFRFLMRRFGDSLERVAWRSKQNLDFAYLMLYSQPFSEFYLQIEDDVIASKNYLKKIEDFVAICAKRPWLYLRFSKLGFIGLLFKSADLAKVSEFFMILFDEKPCDLLINDLRALKGQTKELISSPAIFQHMGLISSLKNKIQRLKDNTFQE